MDQWPNISVIIPTYNRLQIVADTVHALNQLLIYPGKIWYWLGVDNDNENARQVHDFIVRQCGVSVHAIEGPRRRTRKSGSLGANLNMLIRECGSDLIMQMDDDHLLLRAIDLKCHVEKLMNDKTSGWVRLMGVGFHNYCGCMDGLYWRVNWDSPELYITSNRPHLKHRRFHEYFGLYPEGLKLGETEETFCHGCKDAAVRKGGGPQVLVPIDVMTESSWDHIGASFQLQGE